jgi:hypothetical protein
VGARQVTARLPFPEEVSIADALAFEQWPPEQRRIAIAGLALDAMLRERESEARREGFDAGKKAGLDEAMMTLSHTSAKAEVAGYIGAHATARLHELLDRLQLFRQQLATYDTRYNALGEILADFTKALEESR